MGEPIPQRDVLFAKLAVKLGDVTPDQVKGALELYRRYQNAGGEVPSIPRILVGKGLIPKNRAELLLRHLVAGEALPPPANGSSPHVAAASAAPAAPAVPASAAALAAPPVIESAADQPIHAPVPTELTDLPPVASGADLNQVPSSPEELDDREALIRGLGATVLRGEIKGYKILEVIGEGTMGVVYRAHQISMDRIVALKVLPANKTKDQAFVQQFLTEARNAGRLNHPNLIRVHEVGRSGDNYYYSMEYVDGLNLGEMMDEFEGGRLDSRRAVNIFAQVAAALDHGFRSGIIHREVRPDSIMVTEGDQAKLDSLGLIKDEDTRFLQGENAYYVAPEQVKSGTVDTRSDIYSLGCCLFHCLTGEPPFEGGGPKEVLGRRLLAEPPDPAAYNPEVPRELADICRKMMARDNKDRYQTPADVMEGLKAITFAAPSGTHPPTTKTGRGPVRRRGRVRRRRRFRR